MGKEWRKGRHPEVIAPKGRDGITVLEYGMAVLDGMIEEWQ